MGVEGMGLESEVAFKDRVDDTYLIRTNDR